jgi:hypothetical protein
MGRMFNLYTRISILVSILSLLTVVSCKKAEPDTSNANNESKYKVSDDTAFNALDVYYLAPDFKSRYKAVSYTMREGGYATQMLSEFELKDSSGDASYRLRIYTKDRELQDSVYQTSNDKYNSYPQKVYIEFYKNSSTGRINLYTSELPQTYNYFRYSDTDSTDAFLKFRFLSKQTDPETYAIMEGKFRIRK